MNKKIFRRLSYLLFLFLPSVLNASFSGCSDAHKKIDVICNTHSGKLEIEREDLGNEILVYGFLFYL